jgi:hypothetical protein
LNNSSHKKSVRNIDKNIYFFIKSKKRLLSAPNLQIIPLLSCPQVIIVKQATPKNNLKKKSSLGGETKYC